MSQLYISSAATHFGDWAETYSAQLRSYPCHPSSTMTELFLNLVQKLSGIFFPMQLMYHSMCQKVILWLEKVKTWILAWFLCIWIWFCWIVRQKCLLIFGQTLLILAKVCSSWDLPLVQLRMCSTHLQKSRVLLDWGIRTLKKSANFKLFKDFQFYSRSSYFSSLAS